MKVRVNRRIINPYYGEMFACYGIEEKDKFGNWIEKYNFTEKDIYNNWVSNSWRNLGELEKVGDWESYPEL